MASGNARPATPPPTYEAAMSPTKDQPDPGSYGVGPGQNQLSTRQGMEAPFETTVVPH